MKKIILFCIVLPCLLGYSFVPSLVSRPYIFTPPPFGLEFTDTTTDAISAGSDASLDNIAVGTVMLWVLINTESDGHNFIGKRTSATAWLRFLMAGSSDLTFSIERALDDDLRVVTSSNPISTGIPLFIAATWDINGADADQQIFFYNPATVAGLAEATSYTQQGVGSGTVGDESGNAMGIGSTGEGNAGSSCACEISEVWIYNDIDLTLAQIQTVMWGGELSVGTLAFHSRFGANGSITTPGDLSPLQQTTSSVGTLNLTPNMGDDWGQ